MMSVRPSVLLLFLGMALVTYLPRMLPVVVLSRFRLPPLLLRWLEYVPVSVLAAMLAKELLLSGGTFPRTPLHPPLLAAVPAFAVGLLTRSLLGTVVAGMASMAAVRFFLF